MTNILTTTEIQRRMGIPQERGFFRGCSVKFSTNFKDFERNRGNYTFLAYPSHCTMKRDRFYLFHRIREDDCYTPTFWEEVFKDFRKSLKLTGLIPKGHLIISSEPSEPCILYGEEMKKATMYLVSPRNPSTSPESERFTLDTDNDNTYGPNVYFDMTSSPQIFRRRRKPLAKVYRCRNVIYSSRLSKYTQGI